MRGKCGDSFHKVVWRPYCTLYSGENAADYGYFRLGTLLILDDNL